MLGWEPSERHEHYDAEGNPIGYTLIAREPEFTDADRIGLLALQRYEAEVHTCGHHRSLTGDKSNFFEPTVDECAVCAGLAQFQRRLQVSDDDARDLIRKDAKGRRDPKAKDPADGRTVFMRLLSPEEVAERQAAP